MPIGKKKKEFVLINFNKDGPGVTTDEDALCGPPYTTKRGVKLYFTRFWKLISLGIIMLLLVVPLFLAGYFYLTGPQTPTYESILFGPIAGITVFEQHASPALDILYAFHSHIAGVPYVDLAQFIKLAIPLLFLFITFGWQNCGISYIVRSMLRGDPVFIVSDYLYAAKRNLKPGFIMGCIDFLAATALIVDFFYFNGMTGGGFTFDLMFFFIIALAVIYLLMRSYIYLIVITFDMKTKKILKNSLIFVVLGFKRMAMATLLTLLGMLVFFALFIVMSQINLGMTVLLIAMFVMPPTMAFASAYAAYPIIEKYMVIKDGEEDEE